MRASCVSPTNESRAARAGASAADRATEQGDEAEYLISDFDTITFLLCDSALRMAKLIREDGQIVGYDQARTFDAIESQVSDLCALAAKLESAQDRPRVCVVRGALVDGPRREGIRRLVHDDPKTGDAATLRDAPRYWLALDVDDVPLPAKADPADLRGCAEVAISALPAAFHGRQCFVQATASHGLKPGCRLRLWYWLNRPTWGHEIKAWLRGVPVDRSVFNAAQPIYTAAPVFSPRVRDHLPRRSMMLPGLPVVAVPVADDPAPRRLAATSARPRGTVRASATPRRAWAALRNSTTKVAMAAEGDRHATLIRESVALAAFLPCGGLTADDIHEAMGAALEMAGKVDRAEARSAVEWAIARGASA